MEKKKSLSFLLLSIVVMVIGFQVMTSTIMLTAAIDKVANDEFQVQRRPNFGTALELNQIELNFTDTIKPQWFYINIVLIVITPLGFILPTVLIKDRKEEEEPAKELSEDDAIEPVSSQNRIDVDPTAKSGNIVGRIGMMVLFIQNIIILLTYIAFFVLIPIYTVDFTPIDILRVYFILFNIDFVAAILVAVGLIIISLKAEKSKIFAYLATGAWAGFIGVNAYPRWRLVNIFTGDITTTEGALDIAEKLAEYLLTFYGYDVTLQTAAFCFLAIAMVFTTRFLVDNSQLRSKGIVNAFGITNYVVGALMNGILLLLLTFGLNMQDLAVTSLLILYFILILIKLIAVPILGLIASIITFSQMNPKKMKT